MQAALSEPLTLSQQDREISATVRSERARLRAYIRRWIADAAEAEDILQESLYELVLAHRMMQPVEQAGAWLVRVARNRIIDRFRRRGAREHRLEQRAAEADAVDGALADLLPAADAGPEAAAMRALLLAEIETALAQLPPEQREVFIAQELEGISFRELAERLGVSINTLLSRKRYAVRFLRARLRTVWDDWLMR
ncbi:MAG TPA: sigma-70 family RNA polymerase sigma factor [Steroidobacteraceae bacterium]|jgi:RNA polymerase sigma factor (sigma-70 family)|nr:sigma-70 family RNA polymerase sigma factor [Steroidobacteraceae bacterium]